MRFKLLPAAVLSLALIHSPGSAATALAPPFDTCEANHSVNSNTAVPGFTDAACAAPGGFRGEGEVSGLIGGLAPGLGNAAEVKDTFTITQSATEPTSVRVYLATVRIDSARVEAHAIDLGLGRVEILVEASATMGDVCACTAEDTELVLQSLGLSLGGYTDRLNDKSFTLTLVLQNGSGADPLPAGDVVITVSVVGRATVPLASPGYYSFAFDGTVTSLVQA